MTAAMAPVSHHGVGFADLVRSEVTKVRSVRSTVWSLLAMVVVSLGFATIVTNVFSSQWDDLDREDQLHAMGDPIGLILQPGAALGQIAILVFGVMVVASEYSTGMIRSSLLAVPRRIPMLLAKATVVAATVFILAEVVAFVSFFLGRAIMADHVPVSLGDPGVFRSLIGYGLFMSATALFAMAIGALVRHVAGAITAVLGLVLVLPNVTPLIPGSAGEYLTTYLPGGSAGQEIMSTGFGGNDLVTPWQGFGVLAGWTAVLLIAGCVALRRRDA